MTLMVSAESTSSQGHWTLAVATLCGQPLWTFDPCGPSGNPPIMDPMWIDDRGSEVLTLPECRRLLAIGAKELRHGHLGVPKDGAPLVLPVDYAVHGPDVVLRIGEGLFHQVDARLVAFQVDGVTSFGAVEGDQSKTWSVLVQGLAIEDYENVPTTHVPHPQVAEPGTRVVRIRADVVTGRRFATAAARNGSISQTT